MTLTDFKVIKRLGKHSFPIFKFLPLNWFILLKIITEANISINCREGKASFN